MPEVLEFEPNLDEDYKTRAEARKAVKDSLRKLTQAWRDLLSSAWANKMEKFGNDAEEALSFFNEDHSFIWDAVGSAMKDSNLEKPPGFEMTYNVVSEVVQIFGPYIYHRNPNRLVDPVRPLEFPAEAVIDPMLQYEAQALTGNIQQTIGDITNQIMQSLQGQQIDPQQAQAYAQQQASQHPAIMQMQAKLGEINGELSQQSDLFARLKASQTKSVAKKTAKSLIMQRILNYTPKELNLREHSRKVVDEALIKGEGVWWTELKEFDDDDRVLVGSFYDSIDNMLIDADVADFDDAKWVARKRCAPSWWLEQKYGRKPGSIKGTAISNSKRKGSVSKSDGVWAVPNEQPADYKPTNDIVVYWEIWSKMGIGGRLDGVPEEIKDKLEDFGDFCYLVVCENCDEPLNLSRKAMYEKEPDELFMDVQWPIPFHKDGQFPCTPLVFHWVPNSPWGMSHIKPGIGELKFLDFAMSHLARKINSASVDIIGVIASAADDIRKQLEGGDDGSGYKIVEISSHYGKGVSEIFSAVQRPPFHGDIWNVIAAVAQRLDRRLGLTEFNQATQSRSALDAKNKYESSNIRPQDMAKRVEETATVLSRKEALAVAWHMEGKDVAPIIGEEAAFLYDELIYNQDPISIVREYDYQIEADSIRRPSKETEQENMTMLTQTALPGIMNYSMSTQNYGPINAFFKDLGKAFNIDVDGYQFTPPQPPPITPEQQQMMAAQQEIAQLTLQTQIQQARNIEAQMRLAELQVMSNMKIDTVDVEKKQRLAEIEIQRRIAEMEAKIADAVLQRQIDLAEHEQEMEQDQKAFEVTLEANLKGDGDAKMMTNYRRDYRGYH